MIVPFSINAQDLKKQTSRYGRIETEVFYVNKSDKSRQGPYTLAFKSGGIIISGFYSAGQKDSVWTIYEMNRIVREKKYYKKGIKVGTWEFYKKGELDWTYDFDSSKATFIKPEDKDENAEKYVAYQDQNGNWIHFPPAKHALLINSDYTFVLQSNLTYPEEAQNKNQQGKVRVAVLVNQNGNMETMEIGVSSGYPSLDKEALRVMKLTNLEFIPAENNDIKVKSIVLMDVNFRLENY
jgi:TonB family protein